MGKYDRDIVYILKNDIKSDELRYSLRSVCENFPCRNVVFVGGCPNDITPDLHISHQQEGGLKWQKAVSSMKKAFVDDRISDEFFLFNDDFFVLRPIDTTSFVNFTSGTLERRVNELEENLKKHSSYSFALKNLKYLLRTNGYDGMSFAVHMPFLLNKHDAMELMGKYPEAYMFRSLYGNVYGVPYMFHKDVKVYTNDKLPEFDDYLSTSDDAFKNGLIGEYIRNKFPNPCKYEFCNNSTNIKEIYTEEGDDRYEIELLGGNEK